MTLDQAIEAEAQAQAICMQTARFPARLRSLRRQETRRVRGKLMMSDRSFLHWPFFEPRHRELARAAGGLGRAQTSRALTITTLMQHAAVIWSPRSGATAG